MRIAFTHNLQRSETIDEAEFDSPATVAAISDALRRRGHRVEPIDVDVSVPELIGRLRAFGPDLILNTAEGRAGRAREGFYPALFEQLGLAYTGSDAYTCTVTLDKRLTKLIVAEQGVPTPGWFFVQDPDAPLPTRRFPVIVKPNFEGSSKGVTSRSIARNELELEALVREQLADYPDGVLIEGFVPGRDVVVPFVQGLGPEVLAPAVYELIVGGNGHRGDVAIYDYELKHHRSEDVVVRVPAPLPETVLRKLEDYSRRAFDALDVRDLGRIDFRVTPDGQVSFIEVNALPSLEPGASIYAAAALVGRKTVGALLQHIVEHAARRQRVGADLVTPCLRVGLVHNLKRVDPEADDTEAEFDSEHTVEAITGALCEAGHAVVPIEADRSLLQRMGTERVDVVFNIAEGFGGRGRESVVPAVLELLDIPYTGSDAATLAVTLDKSLAKRLARQAGVPTPDFALLASASTRLPAWLTYPAIVKPVAEGSSKGVHSGSVVRDEAELREQVAAILARYEQPALLEAFLPGREFTIGILGGRRPKVLPIMEIIFDEGVEHPVYTFGQKLETESGMRWQVPADVTPALERKLRRTAREAFDALGCRDVARIDLRLDAAGQPCFIECNPLPGLTPDYSDLTRIAEAAGMTYGGLIAAILAPAVARWRARKRLGRGGQDVASAAAGPGDQPGSVRDGTS